MQFTETVSVKIPNLTKSYTFLHISDAHVAYAAPDDPEDVRAHAAHQTKAWMHGDIPPVTVFENVLAGAKEEAVDALLMAGDCIDYISESNARYMRDHLPACGVEVLYAFGNHEGGSYTEVIDDPKASYPELAPVMMGTPDFWVRDYGEFLVIGVDDSDQNVRPAQVEKMKEQIARGLPILLLMHIPMKTPAIEPSVMKKWGTTFMIGTDEDPDSTKEFCELVKSAPNVAAVFAGHIHYEHTGEFAPGRMQYVSAPAFTGFVRKVLVEPS